MSFHEGSYFFLSFLSPFFPSLSYFILTCVLQSIFLVTKMEKTPASLAANSTLDQCTELKQVLIDPLAGKCQVHCGFASV